MKKTLVILLISIFSSTAYAQDTFETLFYSGIESYTELGLTADQSTKIKALNKDIKAEYAKINTNKSLSTLKKGKERRALSLKHKDEIKKVLTPSQVEKWDTKVGSTTVGKGLKNLMDDSYDKKLEDLEAKFKSDEKELDSDKTLSKSTLKKKKQELKDAYKAEKDKLKELKESAKATRDLFQ